MVILNDNWQQRLISEIRSDLPERPKSSLDDLACYVYSSGTTGKPKGQFQLRLNWFFDKITRKIYMKFHNYSKKSPDSKISLMTSQV